MKLRRIETRGELVNLDQFGSVNDSLNWWPHCTDIGTSFALQTPTSAQSVDAGVRPESSAPIGWVDLGNVLLTPMKCELESSLKQIWWCLTCFNTHSSTFYGPLPAEQPIPYHILALQLHYKAKLVHFSQNTRGVMTLWVEKLRL